MSIGDTQLFTPTGELTLQAMRLYSKGALDGPDKLKVKSYLEENPFEADAMEGMATTQEGNFTEGLEKLRSDIGTRVNTPAGSGGMPVKMAYWQAAAAVFIMVSVFATSIFLLERNYVSPETRIAMEASSRMQENRLKPLPPAPASDSEVAEADVEDVSGEAAEQQALPEQGQAVASVTNEGVAEETSSDNIIALPDEVEQADVGDYPSLADIDEDIAISKSPQPWPENKQEPIAQTEESVRAYARRKAEEKVSREEMEAMAEESIPI
ncbi:MAG: hypothetical protein WBG62_12190, partial [Cyclobacteriaceae bacterium]